MRTVGRYTRKEGGRTPPTQNYISWPRETAGMSFPLRAPVRRRDVDFEVGVLLGRGAFTSVYQAVEKATGRRCAMKIVDRRRAAFWGVRGFGPRSRRGP